MKYFRLTFVSLACVIATSGQAVVESAILTGGGAGGAAAGAKGAGSSAAGVLGRVSEIASKSGASSGKSGASSGNGAAERSAAEKTAAPAQRSGSNSAKATVVPARKPVIPQPIDASRVTTGLTREALIACCGEPSTRTTGTRKSKFVETMWYTTTDKDELKVQLEDGVVMQVTSSGDTRAGGQ